MYEPRYESGEDCVNRLRELATDVAMELRSPTRVGARGGWKPKRAIDNERLELKLAAICTCIEVLTVHGSYAHEQHEALVRAEEVHR